MKYEIVLKTDAFLVINKPAGLLSIPDRLGVEISLKDLLKQAYDAIFTVHRLDKDTSGLIVFARNEAEHKFLSKAFEARDVAKFYEGIVSGRPTEDAGTIDEPIMEHPGKKGTMVINRRGRAAVTDYKLLEDYGKFSHLQFQIHTGRTHQIRVHSQFLGHPILCDPIYGDGKPVFLSAFKKKFNLSKNELEERPLLARLALHAKRLVFTDSAGTTHDLEAQLPRDLRALLQQAEKNLKK